MGAFEDFLDAYAGYEMGQKGIQSARDIGQRGFDMATGLGTDIEGKAATAAKSRVRNSIGGSEADIRAALEETKRFFNEAIRKNTAYESAENEKERLLKKWSTGNSGNL